MDNENLRKKLNTHFFISNSIFWVRPGVAKEFSKSRPQVAYMVALSFSSTNLCMFDLMIEFKKFDGQWNSSNLKLCYVVFHILVFVTLKTLSTVIFTAVSITVNMKKSVYNTWNYKVYQFMVNFEWTVEAISNGLEGSVLK